MFKPKSKKKFYQIFLRKLAVISRRDHRFSREMKSENRAKKLHTNDASLPRSGKCFWLAKSFLEPIRSTTQIWVVTRHQYGISALVRRHLTGKPLVASPNVGCFLRLLPNLSVQKKTNEKQMLPCESTAENFPFEWPQFRSRHQKIEQYFV